MACKQLQNPIELTDRSEIAYTVTHTIHDTITDLIFKKKLSGLGGADCTICEGRKSDWKYIEKTKEGFNITRSADNAIALYEQLILMETVKYKEQKVIM